LLKLRTVRIQSVSVRKFRYFTRNAPNANNSASKNIGLNKAGPQDRDFKKITLYLQPALNKILHIPAKHLIERT